MPNSATGLLTGWATAEETTYGTPVAPDRAFEILSATIKRNNKILQSNGLRAVPINLRRGSRRVVSANDASGPFQMEVPTTGFGRILKHWLGGTPTIAQQGGTAAWLQTHTLGSTAGKSLTLQTQLRDSANVLVQQFTQPGAKILDGKFTIGVDAQLLFDGTVDARTENTSTAAAALTYPNNKPFHFAQGALTVGGVSIGKVTTAEVGMTRPQKVDGYYLGSSGQKSEPVENDYPTVEGTLTAEFDSDNKTRLYDAFVADTAVALVLTFTGAVIAGAYNELLRITVPEIHFSGETPGVSGPDLVMINAPFEGAYDGTNAGIKVEYQSVDTSI